MQTDVVVVGAGLAGLVATAELADRRPAGDPARPGARGQVRRAGVVVLRRAVPRRLAGAASARVHDSLSLPARTGSARRRSTATEDHWPRQWAEAYLQFAAGEKRAWLKEQGVGFFPVVGWAERGGYTATGPGNSVPRFHIVWGTGPGVGRAVRRPGAGRRERRTGRAQASGTVSPAWSSPTARSPACGAGSSRRARWPAARPAPGRRRRRSRSPRGAVVVTAGGIGGNHDLVRKNWPARLGPAPPRLLPACPAHVDGRMLRGDRGRRRQRGQPRPHVALHRGRRQPLAGLGQPRHPDPARARPRCGSTPVGGCPCRCSPASTRSARSPTSARPGTSTRGS